MKRVQRGFKAVKEEEKRTKKLREQRQGNLWRIFFPKDADEDYEIPFVFLTDEPICFYEHNTIINGKYTNIYCTGDENCKQCKLGNKPRFMGAFLGIDLRPFEVEERNKNGQKTGKKKTVEASIKLLVRGQTDLAVLNKKSKKYGLEDYIWNITKTGENTSTRWDFEKETDDIDLTAEEIEAIFPDKYRDDKYRDEDGEIDYFKIVEEQVMNSINFDVSSDEDSKEIDNDVQSSVQRIKGSKKKHIKGNTKGKSKFKRRK